MTQTIEEPQQRISPDAVKVWRMSSLIEDFIAYVVLGALLFLHHSYNWVEWVGLILYILIILGVIHSIYEIFIRPIYQQRTWRYDIDERHIQLKHGAIKKTHLIVPMTKVQYVNTNQGPLLRRYGLATIKVGTMASSHDIPAIPVKEAEELRTRIAFLAEITETDE
ncbi:PH domain-containing protein [Bacillus piscicola]|uniref:PH domain-containing protein n=1 Tax=Bacillus piscicola TaxID=1632684 RepID=UPI001F08FDEE|nr:PH domain-containing protein [Bacillus piscicola]